jgi:LacI family transcriptional regulator
VKTRRPTAADVARLSGLSKWTVIRAFRDDASISPESRERVHKVAVGLGYKPNLLARSLATARTNQVAVLVDDFTNPHKLPVIARLSLALQDEGRVLMVININKRFETIDALMHAHQWQVDGVILFANALQDSILEAARAGRIQAPLVILARETTIESVPSITAATRASMFEIGRHLWDRGYRRPGFMSGPSAQSSRVSRYRQFAEFWRGHGITDVPVLAGGSYDRHDAETVMRRYLEATPAARRIDVLACENDSLAIGAMDAARSGFGLRVPQDIAFVGYDNIDMASSPAYALTTYEQPIDKMVAAVLDILDGRIARTSAEIAGQLLVRGST